jgi:superfamily II DNA or RNA helicase/HKD family nuclease
LSLIDNVGRTLRTSLANALQAADRIDIAVGFFYLSGFAVLAEQLRDKHVRVLVGMEIDPTAIPELAQLARNEDVELTPWQPRRPTTSLTALHDNYVEALVGFINDSDIFDATATTSALDLFIEKIENGSLEIRKTIKPEHAKYYVVRNRREFSQSGDFPGTVFMGSSNFTYRGLVGQGELNDSFRDKSRFDEYALRFESMWSSSTSISIADQHTRVRFLSDLKPRIWRFVTPTPYSIYVRVLHEVFGGEQAETLLTPAAITKNRFTDLAYQLDAIRATINRLRTYDGVILADVVGLGKSIIASAVARNLDMRTVIICPPHLIPQWDEYKEEFGIRGSKVFSSGNIREIHARYAVAPEPLLLLIDEAHRFRNEDTLDYRLLHQLCRSHPENKVVLLTATPFHNDPKDVFALLKLFQTPGQATIRSIDNLSLRFRDLIVRYANLRRDLSKGHDRVSADREADAIAAEQRRLIEMVVIRRSRLDLERITRYREDLAQQGFEFAKVIGPELLEYDLGRLKGLYVRTLDRITGETDGDALIGARYQPANYLTNRAEFIKQLGSHLGEQDLKTAQTNLAKFMRRLLVMRFESSMQAFRATLENMIDANQLVEDWWVKLGKVPIMKKTGLPDPDDFRGEDGELPAEGLEQELQDLRDRKGLIAVDTKWLDARFLRDVRHDKELLTAIHREWFEDETVARVDPKLDGLSAELRRLLSESPERKIVVFSAYADTVRYLERELRRLGHSRVVGYTAADGVARQRVVRANFDASLAGEQQASEYDIVVATDALSEGYNLNRAGIVINYDIPYNPTRVIQRVGRINRINKRMFESLFIYNFFPTALGEAETHIRQISTLKIKLFNAVIGSDTRTLTKDEELLSFFQAEYERAEREGDELSWDADHREAYDRARRRPGVLEAALKVPRRSRIKRQQSKGAGAVVFGKKGSQVVFTVTDNIGETSTTSVERALPLFAAEPTELAAPVDASFIDVFGVAKERLFAKHELAPIKGRRARAVKVLMALGSALPESQTYCKDLVTVIKTLDDLSDGTLKDIAELDLRELTAAFQQLQTHVPPQFVKNVFDRAERERGERELILFAEEFAQ